MGLGLRMDSQKVAQRSRDKTGGHIAGWLATSGWVSWVSSIAVVLYIPL